jgi:raffinose synthase
MKVRIILGVLFLTAAFLFSCKGKLMQNEVAVKLSDSSISVSWNGEMRLTGGLPGFQGSHPKFTLVQSRGSSFIFLTDRDTCQIRVHKTCFDNVICFSSSLGMHSDSEPENWKGILFSGIPGYKQGLALWRYKPWNSWSKPVKINQIADLQDWDIQFFYWQNNDGSYGAVLPLGGNGFRTTLGKEDSSFAAKSVRMGETEHVDTIPAMALGFGNDPYLLFSQVFEAGMKAMGKETNLRTRKSFPEILSYLGWCSWNASDMGSALREKLFTKTAGEYQKQHVQLGWMLVDDGWFNHTGNQLNSMDPDPRKFPGGFREMNRKLKEKYGIRHMGVWHAFNGYWNGINPVSPLGKEYFKELFSWTQKERPDISDSPMMTYWFIKPESDSLYSFYSRWHRWMKKQGFSFVKVDNQLVTERMAVNNYPLFSLSEKMHEALYRSIDEQFDGTVINCMDMTTEAWQNFGSSAVGRSVEDYFVYTLEEGYDLQRGNAAAHITQALYNTIYFGQVVWPDFDIFQSHNPNAGMHAIARALSGGPVYLSDKPEQIRGDVILPLIYSNGKIIRADQPPRLTDDCLFQVQSPLPLKAYTFAGNAALMGVFNMADTDSVQGFFSTGQLRGLQGREFLLYEYFSKTHRIIRSGDEIMIHLGRLGYQYYAIIPVSSGCAVLGLTDKYNAPLTCSNIKQVNDGIGFTLAEGGACALYVPGPPEEVTTNKKKFAAFSYQNHWLVLDIPFQPEKLEINIRF